MRDLSKNFDYRQDFYYAIYLLFLLMGLFLANLVLEFCYGSLSFYHFMALLIGGGFFFKFYHEAFSNLLYTFWGLTLILLVTLVMFFFSSLSMQAFPFHGTLTFIMLSVHGVIIYLASSPVYYPRVSWWEFDYRYRSEIKINTIYKDAENEGRLNDIRRGGGSISSFHEFPLGSVVHLKFDFRFEDYEFDVIIGSSSQSIPGRPFSYGVKFISNSEDSRKNYKKLLLNWNTRSKVKLDEKFEQEGRS